MERIPHHSSHEDHSVPHEEGTKFFESLKEMIQNKNTNSANQESPLSVRKLGLPQAIKKVSDNRKTPPRINKPGSPGFGGWLKSWQDNQEDKQDQISSHN